MKNETNENIHADAGQMETFFLFINSSMYIVHARVHYMKRAKCISEK